MNNNTKKTYVAPVIDVMTVELEQGIAAGSGPSVDNWTIGEEQSNNADF